MSDQDFFFDEADDKPEKPKPSKPAKSPATPAKKAGVAASSPPASFWQQSVTTSIAALVAAIALLVGVIVGIVLPVGDTGNGIQTPTAANGVIEAPVLSQEQLESGELPEGHPSIGDMGTVPTATPGADEATATP